VDAASSWIDRVGTYRKVLVLEHTPDADDLEPLGFVSVDQKVIWHRSPSFSERLAFASMVQVMET
jgi:hypothetical protein